jgi:predicted Zn-ribbon and HTH transcriptional regulator
MSDYDLSCRRCGTPLGGSAFGGSPVCQSCSGEEEIEQLRDRLPRFAAAAKDHDDSMMADAWRCSSCGGLTYDAHNFEVPRFCCRCGSQFTGHETRQ